VLQFIGVASVFIGGAILSVRQFFGHYIIGWKRTVFYLSLVVGFLVILWVMLGPQIAKADTLKPDVIEGERLPITTLIKRDKDDWIRDWKLDTIEEMKQELNLARQRRHLSPITFSTVQSFTPKHLNTLIESRNKNVYVLDIREEYERSRFNIKSNGSARYGDLVSNIIPDDLPKDAVIVVLCHSGLRGYLGANVLKRAGFKRAAFLQNGLSSWHTQKLPVTGDVDYKAKKRWQPSAKEARSIDALKVQVDSEGSKTIRNIPDLINLPYETAATNDITEIIQASKQRPVLLACNTYGGCFHTTNFAWLIEHNGGKVAGIYDETGDHLENFF
jgi:rhodanese-related sulfurtransferase